MRIGRCRKCLNRVKKSFRESYCVYDRDTKLNRESCRGCEDYKHEKSNHNFFRDASIRCMQCGDTVKLRSIVISGGATYCSACYSKVIDRTYTMLEELKKKEI